MANKVTKQSSITNDIYTPKLIQRAIGKQCAICDKYISEEEANNKEFECSQTKSKHEIFIHKHCWNKTYRT